MCDTEGYFDFCKSCINHCCRSNDKPRIPAGLTKAERVYLTKYYGLQDFYFISHGKTTLVYIGNPTDTACRYLSQRGCLLGSSRPLACKLFPFGLMQKGHLFLLFRWLGECPENIKDYLVELNWVIDTIIENRDELLLSYSLIQAADNIEIVADLTSRCVERDKKDCEIYRWYEKYSYCKAPMLTSSEVTDYSFALAEVPAVVYYSDVRAYALARRSDGCPLMVNSRCSLREDQPVVCLCFPYFSIRKHNRYYIARWITPGYTLTGIKCCSKATILLLRKYKKELSLDYSGLLGSSFRLVGRL